MSGWTGGWYSTAHPDVQVVVVVEQPRRGRQQRYDQAESPPLPRRTYTK